MSEINLDEVLENIDKQFDDIFLKVESINKSLRVAKSELQEEVNSSLNWQGWEPESGVDKLEYFVDQNVSSKCKIPCEKCAYHYLADDGSALEMENGKFIENKTPLCGVW